MSEENDTKIDSLEMKSDPPSLQNPDEIKEEEQKKRYIY